MKITIDKNTVVATAETMEDVCILLKLQGPKEPVVKAVEPKQKVQVRAKYGKKCPDCGIRFTGLRMHQIRTHQKRYWSNMRRKIPITIQTGVTE
jgi:hypothetical protein